MDAELGRYWIGGAGVSIHYLGKKKKKKKKIFHLYYFLETIEIVAPKRSI